MPGSTGDRIERGLDRALAGQLVIAGTAPCPRACRDDEPLVLAALDPA